MKDMPLFTTENGIASLTLSNIPYTKAAYIQIQGATEPEKLLKECCDFCIAVGAETVYAAGHPYLEMYTHHTSVLELKCRKCDLPATNAVLTELTEKDMERWRQIYWDRMRNVCNASYLSKREMQKRLNDGNCYFINRFDKEIGIGMVSNSEIAVVAGIVPGMGAEIVSALSQKISDDIVSVTVANENKPAMRLYERLGFQRVGTFSDWYKIN